jgi:hypothetical protein
MVCKCKDLARLWISLVWDEWICAMRLAASLMRLVSVSPTTDFYLLSARWPVDRTGGLRWRLGLGRREQGRSSLRRQSPRPVTQRLPWTPDPSAWANSA